MAHGAVGTVRHASAEPFFRTPLRLGLRWRCGRLVNILPVGQRTCRGQKPRLVLAFRQHDPYALIPPRGAGTLQQLRGELHWTVVVRVEQDQDAPRPRPRLRATKSTALSTSPSFPIRFRCTRCGGGVTKTLGELGNTSRAIRCRRTGTAASSPSPSTMDAIVITGVKPLGRTSRTPPRVVPLVPPCRADLSARARLP